MINYMYAYLQNKGSIRCCDQIIKIKYRDIFIFEDKMNMFSFFKIIFVHFYPIKSSDYFFLKKNCWPINELQMDTDL